VQQKKRIIVIGAGFAGLSAAAFMAKSDWHVTVLEKAPTPGGRAKQLVAEGFTFDMGPSWYWMPDVFEHFFHQFGKKVEDYYQLTRLDPSYRVYWHDEAVDVPADYEELKDLFERFEKGSSEKLDQYLKEAYIKYKVGMRDLVYKPALSATEFLNWKVVSNIFRLQVFSSIQTHIARYFKHPKLKQLLEFPVLFLGALPQNTPALYSLMNYADMIGGTWYPEGGMFSIVKAMEQLAKEQGAFFSYNEEVKEILVEKRKAKRIITSKGEYTADAVISGADYHFTETALLPKPYRTYSDAYWNKKVLAPSCLLYYIGLNKKLNNLLHHSLFFDVPFEEHAAQIYTQPQWPKEPLFYVCAPSKTDNSVAPAGHENLFLLVPVASGLKGDTEELREHYFKQIIQRLEGRTGESITDAIVYKKTFSVSDFVNEYNAFKGNAYGLANTLRQTAILRPSCRSKKVKNLFYTGQFTVPGPGVPPSLISGEIVSEQVIKSFKS
jgi:phytoene desaturase